MTTRAAVVLVMLLISGVVGACADLPGLLRRHTYPPNFQYIERGQVRSAMWQLADAATAVDRVLRQPGPIDAPRRAEVQRLLGAMLVATNELQTQGRPTNHPLLSEHIGNFQRDLDQALAGVDAEPPSYYLVGTVSGTCLTCHNRE